MPDTIDERIARRLERVAPRARRILASRPDGGDESAGALESSGRRVGPPDAEDERSIARQLKRQLPVQPATALAGRDPVREAEGIAAELVARARNVLMRLESGASDSSIDGGDALALESVMHTRGRPALCVEGERIEAIDDEKHPGSGFWRNLLNDHETKIVDVTAATGAVVVSDRWTTDHRWVQGTAWLVRNDLVVTNRHVLFPPLGMRLARRVPATTRATFKNDLRVSIDLAFDDGPQRQAIYDVLDVPFVAAEADPIDVAIIRVAPANGSTAATPIALASDSQVPDLLYVVGHPGRMPQVPPEVLAVFGTPNERKRISFGEQMDGDPQRPGEILYDASTIGGYSGGCVLGFGQPAVFALHYYGDPLSGNRAITVSALRAHSVGTFLSL